MSYAILRIEKHGGSDANRSLSGMTNHNKRTINVKNCDPERTHLNKELIGTGDYKADVNKRIAELSAEVSEGKPKLIMQKNSVKSIEHLMTASPEYFKNEDDIKAFTQRSHKFLVDTYGKENVVSMSLHLDEKTPHIHAFVVPVVKGKLKSGREINRISAKQYLNKADKMSLMQDNYAKYFEDIGLERGRKGSKATHTSVKRYYSMLNGNEAIADVKFQHPSIEEKPPRFGNIEKWMDEQNQIIAEQSEDTMNQMREYYLQQNALKVKEYLELENQQKNKIEIKKLKEENKKLITLSNDAKASRSLQIEKTNKIKKEMKTFEKYLKLYATKEITQKEDEKIINHFKKLDLIEKKKGNEMK
jgi:hypothetical protein